MKKIGFIFILCLVFSFSLFAQSDETVQFTRDLKLTDPRMNGEDVKAVQERLLELGYTGKKALCAAAFPPQLMMKLATPEAMEGSIIGYLDPDAPKATERYKDIFKRYYEKNNELPGPMGILAYDSLSWLIAAIEKADTLDTTKVRDTLEKLPFETSYGIARWKGKEMYGINRLAIYPSYWSEVKGGKLVYIGESEAKLIPMIK